MRKRLFPGRVFLVTWLPLLIYSTGLFVISIIPLAAPEIGVAESDKAVHALSYGLLSYMAFRALRVQWGYGWKTSLASAFLASGYGALMELFQYFLPYRSYELLDLLSNSGGAAGAQLIALVLKKPASSTKP